MARIITLTTDFGFMGPFVGVMKGAILRQFPAAVIVDLTHEIPPHWPIEAGFWLARSYHYFPAGTVHVAVVDPGVGTQRRPLAAKIGTQFFVGPDNGFLTPIIEDAEREQIKMEFVELDNPKYFLPRVSRTFHGRDIFAPVAAHLSNGFSLKNVGTPFTDPARIKLSRPEKTSNGFTAHVTLIDIFGNITTDLPASALQGQTDVLFRLRGAEVNGVVESYGHRSVGDLVAVVDSEDFIEIAVVNGNAAQKLGAQVGDVVDVIFPEL
jgi:hypothetical protein